MDPVLRCVLFVLSPLLLSFSFFTTILPLSIINIIPCIIHTYIQERKRRAERGEDRQRNQDLGDAHFLRLSTHRRTRTTRSFVGFLYLFVWAQVGQKKR